MLCGQASLGRPSMAFTVQQSWEHCPTGHLPSVFNKSTTVQQSWEHYSTGHAEQQSCCSSQYSTVQLRVLGWERYSKHLTRRNFYVALTFWTTESGISFNRSSGTTFYVAVKTFCPPTLQKFETKTFLNVNIGGKTSKKLKSGSKMVCSCHLAEQQLLSGFDG